jgi:DNA replication protein DnaC
MPAQSLSTVEHQGHQATLEAHLRALKLTMFLEHYQAYAKDAARIDLSYERFLLALCEAETSHRLTKKIDYAISQAKFPFIKEISSYDFGAMENLPKARILELAQGEYLANAENILLLGAPGLGKTHLALGLALAACRQTKRVRFHKTAALVNDLLLAKRELTLSDVSAKFVKLDLLVLDELGFIAVNQEGAELLFQLISDLYERVSIIVTSNLRFQEWTSIFGSDTITTAFIDRLTHRGHILEFTGESYRYRHRLLQDKTAQGESTSQAG